jgi:phospholipid/cholesterol/gamma-HCH transport system substrate-binding protein
MGPSACNFASAGGGSSGYARLMGNSGVIPANVAAQIRATTVFGAKYVDLIYPNDPNPKSLAPGATVAAQNVSSEVNTVFENVVALLKEIEPAKLNTVLSAFAEGLRGQGSRIGEAIGAANQLFSELNPRAATIQRDWRSLKGFSDMYSDAAPNIIEILDALSTTSKTISGNATSLDALLLNVIGLSQSGISLFGPNRDNFVHGCRRRLKNDPVSRIPDSTQRFRLLRT